MGEFLNISNEGGYNLGASASDSIQVLTKSYYDREMLLTSTTEFQQNTSTGKTVDSLVAKDLIKNVEDTKSELLSDQQLVYRKTANGALTWEPSALMLNSIKGKTLVWNQLTENSAMTMSGTSSITYEEGFTTCVLSNETSQVRMIAYFHQSGFRSGDKVIVLSYVKQYNVANAQFDKVTVRVMWNLTKYIAASTPVEYKSGNIIAAMHTINNDVVPTDILGFYFDLYNGGVFPHTTDDSFTASYNIFNLTKMFGAGNEPSTVEEFISMFHLPYYEYNPGTLIFNDAEAFETVGFNLWDEEWEIGRFDTTTGANVAASNQIRCKNIIPVKPNTRYYANTSSIYDVFSWVMFYDANGNIITDSVSGAIARVGNMSSFRNNEFITPATAAYFKFYLTMQYGNEYNHDICINLSDPTKNGTYEPYRKSTLHLGLNAIKVNSQNIWDEEWESGSIDSATGVKYAYANAIRSENFIPIFPNTAYFYKSSLGCAVYYYDADKKYLGQSYYGSVSANTLFTTPAGAYYMLFRILATTYNNDICINISSSFNGQYEPHGVLTITGGLKSAGSVYDEIVGNKYIKRVGSVDLGTLDWYYNSNDAFFYAYVGGKIHASHRVNIICPKYVTASDTSTNAMSDKQVGCSGTDARVYVKDSEYTNVTAFKAAMSGVMLYYELETPIEYELVVPMVYATSCGTIESRISPDALGLSAPLRADIRYGMRQGDVVETAQAFSRWYSSQGIGGDNVVTSQLGGLKIMIVDDESQIGEDANTIYILKG